MSLLLFKLPLIFITLKQYFLLLAHHLHHDKGIEALHSYRRLKMLGLCQKEGTSRLLNIKKCLITLLHGLELFLTG